MADISGSNSGDFLIGTPNPDTITGYAGNDWMYGGLGADTFVFGTTDPRFVQEGNPDRILDFTHSNFSTQNNDILEFLKPITAYYVEHVFEGIRIVTAEGPLKEGSILLSGVSASQWHSWGGNFGWQITSTPGLVNLESHPQDSAQGTSSTLQLGNGANVFDHTGAHPAQTLAQPVAPDSSGVFGVAEGQLHENPFTHMHTDGFLLV